MFLINTRYAEDAKEAAKGARDGKIAALIIESVASVPGMVLFPEGYVARIFEHCRAAGGLAIADEVQCGFGRTGSHYWGFQSQGAEPDIVTLGKPIGNGFPLAAVVTTREIADRFANGMEYFNTFGGNAVACSVGLAVLEAIDEDGLMENARVVGEHMLGKLRWLQERHRCIGHVRGLGLFLGMDICDPDTKEPNADLAVRVSKELRDRGNGNDFVFCFLFL